MWRLRPVRIGPAEEHHCFIARVVPIHCIRARNAMRTYRLENNPRANPVDILRTFATVEAFKMTAINAEYCH